MKDIPTKSPGSEFFSDECNAMADELENSVTGSGIGLSAGDPKQLSKSMANYSASGNYFNDTGIANTYAITQISPKSGPTSYFTGMKVRFLAGNSNTGASTVNVNSIGVKTITDSNGQALNGGEIIANRIYELVYSGTDFIIDSSTDLYTFKPLFNEKVGLEVSNNTTDINKDIDFSPGSFVGTDTSGNSLAFNLYTALTKKLDANWAAGTNQGGFPSGLTLTADTWYHSFAIATDAGIVDSGVDTSLTAVNLRADATGYNKFLRLPNCAIYVDSFLNVLPFFLVNDTVIWDSPQLVTSTITSAYTDVLLVTPLGINTTANINVSASASAVVGGSDIEFRHKFQTGGFSIMFLEPSTLDRGVFSMVTDTSSTVQHQYTGNVPAAYALTTMGWSENT